MGAANRARLTIRGGDPPEIERAHRVLRGAALVSEDPTWRRHATDPSFRSRDAVSQHYYLVRRTRSPERRPEAPTELQRTWREYERDPEAVLGAARRLRESVMGETNPYGLTDRIALRMFLVDVASILEESVEMVRTLPASRALPELVTAHRSAWADLRERDALTAIIDELEPAETSAALDAVGLWGSQLGFKLTGWMNAFTEWREARTADALRRAFRWANLIVGSLGSVVTGPGLELFKEFKEGTEAVLDEAVRRVAIS